MFELLITKILSQVGGTGKDVNYHDNILLIDLGVLFVKLLAKEVSIFAATNLPKFIIYSLLFVVLFSETGTLERKC